MCNRYPIVMAVSTPCTKVCAMDASGRMCRGCGRTLDEIARWASISETERRAIMARLAGNDGPASPIA